MTDAASALPPIAPAAPLSGAAVLTRRSLAAVLGVGYAAYALAADADPIHTDEQGLVIETTAAPEGSSNLPLYVARPAGRGRYAAILVVSEVFGVHEYVKDVCRRLAKLGYVAVAPAFFYRADPDNTLARTTDFSTVTRIVHTAKNAQVMSDVGATLAWLETRPFVDAKRLAITGFCWGGAVVWMSVDAYPQLKAGIAWYGRLSRPPAGALGSDDDRKWPLEIAPELKTPVLALYGGKDQGIPASDIAKMRAALAAAGQTEDQLIVYPEAQHGFHADYRTSYDPKAAEDGWARMLAFLSAERVPPGPRRGFFG